jgi:hypothetical protein
METTDREGTKMKAMTRFSLALGAVLAFPGAALASDAVTPEPVDAVWVSTQARSVPIPEPVAVIDTAPEPVAKAAIKRSVADLVRKAPAAPKTTVKAKSKVRTYTLSPVTALGSQKAVDRGNLVTWMTRPTCLLAGHDNMGWAWLDNVPNGSVVKVTRGPCAGKYRVVTHKWQARKGGPIPAWMSSYDLVLQTCTGKTGMGFSVARRI